jgi:ubiquinone/menaquinone biosynthesis C-methylase UbiE
MKMITPRKLKSLYEQGQNIGAILREEKGTQHNTEEIIEITYDLQTGSYIKLMQNEAYAKNKEAYTAEIARTILTFCDPSSILEAGIGEATTMASVLKNLNNTNIRSYGFDLSWSRVAYAKRWLWKSNISNVTLCTGSLFHIPFANDSIDIVYTYHSIESNGGQEEPILRELYRITKKFLILLEPAYEFANPEAKRRMESHGYCRNLNGISQSLGYAVIEHKPFPFTDNPLNPSALTIIKKNRKDTTRVDVPETAFVCPKYKVPLKEIGGMLFSPEGLIVYPILAGIPCLRIENSIVASKYPEILEAS